MRHNVINYYDRRITHLSDNDTSFILCNPFNYFPIWVIASNALNIKEILQIQMYMQQNKIYILS